MPSDEEKQIKGWLQENEIKLSDDQVSSLLTHAGMIREYSSRINLISKSDLPRLIQRHLLDSLAALKAYDIPSKARVADCGSGAGYPGIPVAIARPDIQMYLIESRRRKCLFLARVVNAISLANAMIINDRWENLHLLYDVILLRAVVKEVEIEEKIMSRLTPSGVVLYFAKHNQIKILKK